MDNPKTDALPGDILYGHNNRNLGNVSPHYIIFLALGDLPDSFLGAMLTHSDRFGNIPLKKEHFEEVNNEGNLWDVQYETSYISADLYHKLIDWRPFDKVGRLTPEGLNFILTVIGHKDPILSRLNAP